MSEDVHRIERLVSESAVPPPDAALRDRVLAAAMPLVRANRAATWSDRIWFSTRWRLAGAALLAGLVALDTVPATTTVETAPGFGRAAFETARAAEEMARQVGLSREDARRVGQAALIAASRPDPVPQPAF